MMLKHGYGVCCRLISSPNIRRNVFNSRGMSSLPTLTLYSQPHGHLLCEQAKQTLGAHGHRFHFEEVDICAEGNEVFYELYKYEVPVVHLNQMEVMKQFVYEQQLVDSLINYDLMPYTTLNNVL